MGETVELLVQISGKGEIDAWICVSYKGELVDIIGGCRGLPVKDHGKTYCHECKQNGGNDVFDTYEEFYSDHFGELVQCARACMKYGVITDGKGWAQPAIDELLIRKGRFVCKVSKIEIPAMTSRDRKSRHKRAVYQMVYNDIEAY